MVASITASEYDVQILQQLYLAITISEQQGLVIKRFS